MDYSNRDWPEDFPHDNGNYSCLCCSCKKHFYGHKRRITCKVCEGKQKERDLNSKSESRSTVWDGTCPTCGRKDKPTSS